MRLKFFPRCFLIITIFIQNFNAFSSGSEAALKIDDEFVSIATEFDCDWEGEYLEENEYLKYDPNKRLDEQINFIKTYNINGRDGTSAEIGEQETSTLLKQTRPFFIEPVNPIFMKNILVYIRVTSIYCRGKLITTTEGIYDFYTNKALYRRSHKQLLNGASLPLSDIFIEDFQNILNEI